MTGLGEALVPIDPDRRLAAHLLSQLRLRFAWFHEMFHGLNGHSGYLAAVRKGGESLNKRVRKRHTVFAWRPAQFSRMWGDFPLR